MAAGKIDWDYHCCRSGWRSVISALGARRLVGCKGGMGLVVEYHAVLHHLNHRHALVHGCGHDALLRELHLHVDRPREEGSLGADHQLAGVERLLDRSVGGDVLVIFPSFEVGEY